MTDKQTITLDEVTRILKAEYTRAVGASFIKRPMSYALYQVWKYVDRKERERSRIELGDILPGRRENDDG